MREDLKEREERVNHTHHICHLLKVYVTNSLCVSLFEGQHRGEGQEASHRNVEILSDLKHFLVLLKVLYMLYVQITCSRHTAAV